MKTDLFGLARRVARALTHNAGYKLLAVVCAVLLWSYVVASNPDTVREKTFDEMEITVTGNTTFENRELALLDDLSKTLPKVRVQMDVPQGNYSRATPDSVSVELDLSRINLPGVTKVRLRARSAYGTVTQLTPSEVEVSVDKRTQRNVPVNVNTIGEINNNLYYDSTRNPYQVSISGPASLVGQVNKAVVEIDVTGMADGTQERVESYKLLDATDAEIVSPVITRSTATVSVRMNVLPKLNMRINTDKDRATNGSPAKNYQVTSVEIQPETVDVVAEATLLDTLLGTELFIEPVNVDDRSATYTTKAGVRVLNGIQRITSDEVNVTVHIGEIQHDQPFRSIPVTLVSAEGRKVKLNKERVNVVVSGPVTVVTALKKSDIIATIDVKDVPAGEGLRLPVQVKVINHPELAFEVEPEEILLTITDD